ncbi:hypothetical protein BV25DRAFT_1830819 [Artomyces pyxidatus]|uniref:Uncharacterized protein n=1 Tax=Artomyces pyxidatus TaxID=48021 RepID=A0ACB8SMQ8_9AGAM|nr:hypothetical protein BV25DRAFT_1830819 [Artomyces pyxidatus]
MSQMTVKPMPKMLLRRWLALARTQENSLAGYVVHFESSVDGVVNNVLGHYFPVGFSFLVKPQYRARDTSVSSASFTAEGPSILRLDFCDSNVSDLFHTNISLPDPESSFDLSPFDPSEIVHQSSPPPTTSAFALGLEWDDIPLRSGEPRFNDSLGADVGKPGDRMIIPDFVVTTAASEAGNDRLLLIVEDKVKPGTRSLTRAFYQLMDYFRVFKAKKFPVAIKNVYGLAVQRDQVRILFLKDEDSDVVFVTPGWVKADHPIVHETLARISLDHRTPAE